MIGVTLHNYVHYISVEWTGLCIVTLVILHGVASPEGWGMATPEDESAGGAAPAPALPYP